MARSARRPRRGSVYRLKLAAMFRFQASSSSAQCHQFRSPAWKMVRPSAVTIQATPSSVEGKVSTVTPGRGSQTSCLPQRRHLAAVSGARCHFSRFRGVKRRSLPSRNCMSGFCAARVNTFGLKWSSWRWLTNTSRGLSGRDGTGSFHQSNSRQRVSSSMKKPSWAKNVTRM